MPAGGAGWFARGCEASIRTAAGFPHLRHAVAPASAITAVIVAPESSVIVMPGYNARRLPAQRSVDLHSPARWRVPPLITGRSKSGTQDHEADSFP